MIFVVVILFSFILFLPPLEFFLFSSKFSDVTYPGHIYQVIEPLLDIYFQLSTVYWADKHFTVLQIIMLFNYIAIT